MMISPLSTIPFIKNGVIPLLILIFLTFGFGIAQSNAQSIIDTITPSSVCVGETLTVFSNTFGAFNNVNGLSIGSQSVPYTLYQGGNSLWTIMPDQGLFGPDSIEIKLSVFGLGISTDSVYFKGPSPNVKLDYSHPKRAEYCMGDSGLYPPFTSVIQNSSIQSIPQGLVFSTGGAIDLLGSPAGVFEVVYSALVPGFQCIGRDTDSVWIQPVVTVNISYPSKQLCKGDGPQPLSIMGDTNGVITVTSAQGGNLSINSTQNSPAFGTVYPLASDADTFLIKYQTTGFCKAVDSVILVIDSVPDASFGYTQSVFCLGDSPYSPTGMLVSGGNFYSQSGLGLDWAFGVIYPTFSSPGNYLVFRDLVINNCPTKDSFAVSVLSPASPYFSYPDSSFCQYESDPEADSISVIGGHFSELTGSVVFLDSTVGKIDLSSSIEGGPYAITYSSPGTCQSDTSINIAIVQADDPSFAYSDPVCINGLPPYPLPSSLNATGGHFSLLSGQVSVDTTGQINMNANSIGIVIIQHLTQGACPDSSMDTLEIIQAANASFSYVPDTVCKHDSFPIANIAGVMGGIFSSVVNNNNLVFQDSVKGTVDLLNSLGNSYHVIQYTTPMDSGCQNSSIGTLYIQEESPQITYPKSSYCAADGTAAPSPLASPFGQFTAPVWVSIDAIGQIDLELSVPSGSVYPDSFFVKYTTPSCAEQDSFQITLYSKPKADFEYERKIYCKAENFAFLKPDTLTPYDSTGVFSVVGNKQVYFSDNQGTIFLDTNVTDTGTIIIQHYVPSPSGLCDDVHFFSIFIEPYDQVDTLAYPDPYYCKYPGSIAAPNTPGTGGVFDYHPSSKYLDINETTGIANVEESDSGTYQIYYFIAGACSDTSWASLEIKELDEANFTYLDSTLCDNHPDNLPLPPGAPGLFSISPYKSNLLDSLTGRIILEGENDFVTFTNYTIHFQTFGACPNSHEQEVIISPAPEFTLEYDPVICDSVVWNLRATDIPFIISTEFSFIVGSDSATEDINKAGEYRLNEQGSPWIPPGNHRVYIFAETDFSTQNQTCTFEDSLELTINPIPEIILSDVQLTSAEDAKAHATLISSVDSTIYLWEVIDSINFNSLWMEGMMNPSDAGMSMNFNINFELSTPLAPGRARIKVVPEAKSCLGPFKTLDLNFNPNDESLFIPGLFTPNGDGKNDTWLVQAADGIDLSDYSAKVFNRGGGMVYEMDPVTDTWKAEGLPDGVYWYIIYREKKNGAFKRGGLTIKRTTNKSN